MVGRAIPFLVIRRGKCTATSTILVAHITVCSTKSRYLRQTWLMFDKKKAREVLCQGDCFLVIDNYQERWLVTMSFEYY